MIVLDTNVVSALMADSPEAAVVDWFDRQPAESIWTTAITVFEVRLGIAGLPAGKRRTALQAEFEKVLAEDIEHRILDFDGPAAAEAAALAAARNRKDRPVDVRDTFIAGIVVARRATLATRNVAHFSDLPVPVVDPWHG